MEDDGIAPSLVRKHHRVSTSLKLNMFIDIGKPKVNLLRYILRNINLILPNIKQSCLRGSSQFWQLMVLVQETWKNYKVRENYV